MMDFGSLILSILFLSLATNVALLCAVLPCCRAKRAVIDKARAEEIQDSEEEEGAVAGKCKSKGSSTQLHQRQSTTTAFCYPDEIVVFTKFGKVFHKGSCKHVVNAQNAPGSRGDTKVYTSCKDCFK